MNHPFDTQQGKVTPKYDVAKESYNIRRPGVPAHDGFVNIDLPSSAVTVTCFGRFTDWMKPQPMRL